MTTDLEPAIARLETAASTWFKQELHRDLQSLIAAARAADLSEPLRSTKVNPPKSASDPRLDKKARRTAREAAKQDLICSLGGPFV